MKARGVDVGAMRFARRFAVWFVPVSAGLCAALIGVMHSNVEVFLFFNHLGLYTGDAVWQWITVLGDGAVVLSLGLLLTRRRPDLVWALVWDLTLVAILSLVCKAAFDLKRPPAVMLEQVHVIGPAHREHSFPSGHVLTIFAFAGVIALRAKRRSVALIAVGSALLIGISRMAVGVHWPLDVLGGAAGGWIAAALAVHWSPRWRWGLRAAPQVLAAVIFAACSILLILGYKTGYPEAQVFLRAIGIVTLAGLALSLISDKGRSTVPGDAAQ